MTIRAGYFRENGKGQTAEETGFFIMRLRSVRTMHSCVIKQSCVGGCHGDLESTLLRGIPGMKLPRGCTDELVAALSRRVEANPESKS